MRPASKSGGLPTGDVYMQTRCGGSGRGGGYKTTTYSAWAHRGVGLVRQHPQLRANWKERPKRTRASRKRTPTVTASTTKARGPIWKRANRRWWHRNRPTEVNASAFAVEVAEEQPPEWELQVSWTPAPATAALITSSTVTATPVGSSAPVLSTTVSGSGATLAPLAYHTTYSITVTNSRR